MLHALRNPDALAGPGPSAAPDFRAAPHDGRAPSFRYATWTGIRDGSIGAGSTHRRAFLRLRMNLSPREVTAASNRILVRHPVLTSVLARNDDKPVLLMQRCPSAEVVFADISALCESQRLAAAERIAGDHVWRSFDLHAGPLFRPILIRLGDNDHILGFAVHHLVSDALSCSILLQDLFAPKRSAAALGYEHYLLGMHEWMRSAAGRLLLERQARRIIERGSGASLRCADASVLPHAVDVPLNFERALATRIADVAARCGASTFALLVAAFAISFDRPASASAVTIGGVIAGRENPVFRNAVGYFSDRTYWNVDVSGDPSFGELLRRLRREFAESAPYQYIRSDYLLESLREAGHEFAAPILNFRAAPRAVDSSASPSLIERFEIPAPAFTSNPGPQIPFWISLVETGTGISGHVRATPFHAKNLASRVDAVLRRVAADETIKLSALGQS